MLLKKKNGIMVVLIAVFFMGACAGNKLNVEPIATSENPIEQVNLLEKDIIKARNNQLDVLAPTWFRNAEESLNDAKEAVELGNELSLILEKVANGHAQLRRAEEISRLVKTALKDTIKAREQARSVGNRPSYTPGACISPGGGGTRDSRPWSGCPWIRGACATRRGSDGSP